MCSDTKIAASSSAGNVRTLLERKISIVVAGHRDPNSPAFHEIVPKLGSERQSEILFTHLPGNAGRTRIVAAMARIDDHDGAPPSLGHAINLVGDRCWKVHGYGRLSLRSAAIEHDEQEYARRQRGKRRARDRTFIPKCPFHAPQPIDPHVYITRTWLTKFNWPHSCQLTPSRSVRAIASEGPQVPAA